MMSEMEDMMREYRDLVDEINWMHAELHGAEMEAEKLRKTIVSMNILFDGEMERMRKAATMERGTCKAEEYEDTGILVCSECGALLDDDRTAYYCWCCGRKII